MNAAATSDSLQTLIVIGNGMVGHHCVEQLIARGALERYRITVFGEETRRAYDRVHLSDLFSGRSAQDLALATVEDYESRGVALRTGVRALAIDRAAGLPEPMEASA